MRVERLQGRGQDDSRRDKQKEVNSAGALAEQYQQQGERQRMAAQGRRCEGGQERSDAGVCLSVDRAICE